MNPADADRTPPAAAAGSRSTTVGPRAQPASGPRTQNDVPLSNPGASDQTPAAVGSTTPAAQGGQSGAGDTPPTHVSLETQVDNVAQHVDRAYELIKQQQRIQEAQAVLIERQTELLATARGELRDVFRASEECAANVSAIWRRLEPHDLQQPVLPQAPHRSWGASPPRGATARSAHHERPELYPTVGYDDVEMRDEAVWGRAGHVPSQGDLQHEEYGRATQRGEDAGHRPPRHSEDSATAGRGDRARAPESSWPHPGGTGSGLQRGGGQRDGGGAFVNLAESPPQYRPPVARRHALPRADRPPTRDGPYQPAPDPPPPSKWQCHAWGRGRANEHGLFGEDEDDEHELLGREPLGRVQDPRAWAQPHPAGGRSPDTSRSHGRRENSSTGGHGNTNPNPNHNPNPNPNPNPDRQDQVQVRLHRPRARAGGATGGVQGRQALPQVHAAC